VGGKVTARDEVLARIRHAVGDRPTVEVPRDYQHAGEAPASLALFAERLQEYGAVVHQAVSMEVAALLRRVVQGPVVVADGFPNDWQSDLQVLRDSGLTPELLDGIGTAVTTCALAIAETGTIIVDSGPGQGRRALTLVPDHHVVVVRAEQVVATVPQALRRLDPIRPQTWISGPSATSDIELQRVEGVHGPRRLEVVLIP
jgi:L-lactate dehydrogenase complex protein LldG